MTLALTLVSLPAHTLERGDDTPWRVTEIYLATLGYAPDVEGVDYWVENIRSDPSWTPTTVAQSFFDQPLVQEAYPESLGHGPLIESLYENLFDRPADAEGRAYWLEALETGRVQRNEMIIALIDGGWGNPDAEQDMARFGNRVRVALRFLDYQNEHGIQYGTLSPSDQRAFRQAGRDVVAGVGADPGDYVMGKERIPGLLKAFTGGQALQRHEEEYNIIVSTNENGRQMVDTVSFDRDIKVELRDEDDQPLSGWTVDYHQERGLVEIRATDPHDEFLPTYYRVDLNNLSSVEPRAVFTIGAAVALGVKAYKVYKVTKIAQGLLEVVKVANFVYESFDSFSLEEGLVFEMTYGDIRTDGLPSLIKSVDGILAAKSSLKKTGNILTITDAIETAADDKFESVQNELALELIDHLLPGITSDSSVIRFTFMSAPGLSRLDKPLITVEVVEDESLREIDGLNLYYSFNGSAQDMSGNGHHGHVVNAVLAPGRLGSPDSSYRFNGVDAFINVPDSAIDASQGTIGIWFKANSAIDRSNVFAAANFARPAGTRLYIEVLPGFTVRSRFLASVLGEVPIEQGAWHHAVLAWDEEKASFYVDGARVGEMAGGIPTTTRATLGAYGEGHDSFFDGLIDEIKIYNRRLSEREIKELIDGMQPTPPSPELHTHPSQGQVTMRWDQRSGWTYNVFVSRDADCDVRNYTSCTEGRMMADVVSGATIGDLDRDVDYYVVLEFVDDQGYASRLDVQQVRLEAADPSTGASWALWISEDDDANNVAIAPWNEGRLGPVSVLTDLRGDRRASGSIEYVPAIDRIAFRLLEGPSRDDGRIYLMDRDGDNKERLSDIPVGAFAFSPDGTQVIFAKGDRDQGRNINEVFIKDIDSKEVTRVFGRSEPRGTNTHKTAFIWAAEDEILFSDTRVWSDFQGQHNNWVYRDGVATPLTSNTSSGESVVSMSPDGTKVLLYMRAASSRGRGASYIEWPDGESQIDIFPRSMTYRVPTGWASDSQIFYRVDDDIWSADLSGGNKLNLTEEYGIRGYGFHLIRIMD
nr:LamG-like jellyroll fold domain-containing protein [Ectothiorhodospira variabilis]